MSERGLSPDPGGGAHGASRPAERPSASAGETPARLRLREQRPGLGLLLALTAVLGFGTWFLIEEHRSSQPVAATPTTVTQTQGPTAVSPAGLRSLAASVGHAVYWVGPRPDTTYELTVSAGGQTVLRYLPKGVPVGSSHAYLTIGTYPVANAFAATSSLIGAANVAIAVPNNGVGEYPKGKPNDIHVAFQGGDVQVEVFTPSPTAAPKLVSSGAVVPV